MSKFHQQHLRRCLLTTAIGLSLAAGSAHADTFSVTTNADAGPGSLRQAIEEVNLAAEQGGHLIDLSSISGQTILLESSLPEIAYNEDPLQLEGGDVTLDGAGQFRCIRSLNPFLSDGNDLTIRDLTVQNCAGHPQADGDGFLYFGGGINIASGSLTLERVTVQNNTADYGGGVWASGAATVIDSVITGNSAEINVGGINGADSLSLIRSEVTDNSAGNNAGGFRCTTALAGCDLMIEDSVITGNSAALAGGGLQYAKYAGQTSVIERSTISNNIASDAAGGLLIEFADTPLAVITDSTISGNQAGSGGGIVFSAIGNTAGSTIELDISGSTVAANSASDTGGGILLDNPAADDGVGILLTLANSIVQGNNADIGSDITASVGQTPQLARLDRAAEGLAQMDDGRLSSLQVSPDQILQRAADLDAAVPSGSIGAAADIAYTLIGNQPDNVSVNFDTASEELLGGDAALGPLADNGGLTPTHLPSADSIVLDAIPVGESGCGGTFNSDQRGLPRPAPETEGCDLGAVELQERGEPLPPPPPPLAVPVGNPIALAILGMGMGLLGWLGLRRRHGVKR